MKMTHSNWEEKSDLVYAPAVRRAPLILDSDQKREVDQGEGTKAMPPNQGKKETGNIYQRTTSRTLYRYKLLKSNVVSESEHTIKLKNGSMLRKSVVAVRPEQTSRKNVSRCQWRKYSQVQNKEWLEALILRNPKLYKLNHHLSPNHLTAWTARLINNCIQYHYDYQSNLRRGKRR